MVEMVEVSKFTEILMDQVQVVALIFMATVYALKIGWIFKHKAVQEVTPSRGDEKMAIIYSFANLVMPWEMESYRQKPFMYVEFVIYHLGAAVCILSTFLLPYESTRWLVSWAPLIFLMRALTGGAFLIGLHRIYRRYADPAMKAITNKDDLFSLFILNGWLLAAFFALPQQSEFWLILFFSFTTFFLFYVPFSKISHYIYYPFVRYHMGKHFGHRATWPRKTDRPRMINAFNCSTVVEEPNNVR